MPVPLNPVAVAEPSDNPKQLICEPLYRFATEAVTLCAVEGCAIVTLLVARQLLASATVTVYVPAARPVALATSCPFDQT